MRRKLVGASLGYSIELWQRFGLSPGLGLGLDRRAHRRSITELVSTVSIAVSIAEIRSTESVAVSIESTESIAEMGVNGSNAELTDSRAGVKLSDVLENKARIGYITAHNVNGVSFADEKSVIESEFNGAVKDALNWNPLFTGNFERVERVSDVSAIERKDASPYGADHAAARIAVRLIGEAYGEELIIDHLFCGLFEEFPARGETERFAGSPARGVTDVTESPWNGPHEPELFGFGLSRTLNGAHESKGRIESNAVGGDGCMREFVKEHFTGDLALKRYASPHVKIFSNGVSIDGSRRGRHRRKSAERKA